MFRYEAHPSVIYYTGISKKSVAKPILKLQRLHREQNIVEEIVKDYRVRGNLKPIPVSSLVGSRLGAIANINSSNKSVINKKMCILSLKR